MYLWGIFNVNDSHAVLLRVAAWTPAGADLKSAHEQAAVEGVIRMLEVMTMRKGRVLIAWLMISAPCVSCRSPVAPTPVDAANVAGELIQASGAGFVGVIDVVAHCSPAIDGDQPIQTSANGTFIVTFHQSAAQMNETGGKMSCLFAAPSTASAEFRTQVVITAARGPLELLQNISIPAVP